MCVLSLTVVSVCYVSVLSLKVIQGQFVCPICCNFVIFSKDLAVLKVCEL